MEELRRCAENEIKFAMAAPRRVMKLGGFDDDFASPKTQVIVP